MSNPRTSVVIPQAMSSQPWILSQKRLLGSIRPGMEIAKVKKTNTALKSTPNSIEYLVSDDPIELQDGLPSRGVFIKRRFDATLPRFLGWCMIFFVMKTTAMRRPPEAAKRASAIKNESNTLSRMIAMDKVSKMIPGGMKYWRQWRQRQSHG